MSDKPLLIDLQDRVNREPITEHSKGHKVGYNQAMDFCNEKVENALRKLNNWIKSEKESNEKYKDWAGEDDDIYKTHKCDLIEFQLKINTIFGVLSENNKEVKP